VISLFLSFFFLRAARPFTCRKFNRVIFFIFSRMVFLSLSHSDSFFSLHIYLPILSFCVCVRFLFGRVRLKKIRYISRNQTVMGYVKQ
jgi:hypothetical protein